MSYVNSDGLLIKTDGEEGITQKGGLYPATNNPVPNVAELVVDFGDIPVSAAIPGRSSRGAYGVVIPKGVRIERVEVVAETAATSGGAATLDVGLVRLNGTVELDYNGLVAALPLANINVAGEVNLLTPGVTSAGALVGTTLTEAGILTVNYGTAAFTAGKIKVRISFHRPLTVG